MLKFCNMNISLKGVEDSLHFIEKNEISTQGCEAYKLTCFN